MLETFIKIRTTITFIQEEAMRVSGSDEIKKEIFNVCNNISHILGKIGDVEESQIVIGIKNELNIFDDIIKRIENDNLNKTLYLLLICHVSDLRFYFLSKEEQENILFKFNKK